MIITQNGRDFRKLVGRETSHPGLIILPSLDKARTWDLLQTALAFLAVRGDPSVLMINHVLEVATKDAITLSPLPAIEPASPA